LEDRIIEDMIIKIYQVNNDNKC